VLTGAAVTRPSVWRDGEFGAGDQRRLIREDPDHAYVPSKLRWAIWIVYGHACCGVSPLSRQKAQAAHPYQGSRLRRNRYADALRAEAPHRAAGRSSGAPVTLSDGARWSPRSGWG
jgi:hypothetical protein